MSRRPKTKKPHFRLVVQIEPDLLKKIEEQARHRGYGSSRSQVVRDILRRALLGARDDRDSGVRAVG